MNVGGCGWFTVFSSLHQCFWIRFERLSFHSIWYTLSVPLYIFGYLDRILPWLISLGCIVGLYYRYISSKYSIPFLWIYLSRFFFFFPFLFSFFSFHGDSTIFRVDGTIHGTLRSFLFVQSNHGCLSL